MSCPSWSRLAEERRRGEAAAAEEPAAWRAAVEHLDGCTECREAALVADPALLFRRLPTVEADAAMVEEMRSGVAALRRAQRLTGAIGHTDGSEAGRQPSRWWRRAAAAAILVVGLLGFRPDVQDTSRMPSDPWSQDEPVPLALLSASADSAMDEIDLPNASVYHFDEGEFGMVFVVDSELDV